MSRLLIWVATHTQALNPNGQLLGGATAGQQLEVSAVLPLRNSSKIAGMIEAGNILTRGQVAATFGPTPGTIQAVEAYLESSGFTNVSASGNGLLVTGYGTVAHAEHAFNTTISNYQLDGGTVYANTAPAMVPTQLAGGARRT